MDLKLHTPLSGSLVLCSVPLTDAVCGEYSELYKFIWQTEGTLRLEVDHVPLEVAAGEIVCLSPIQHLAVKENGGQTLSLFFNSNFYCIFSEDSEVSCSGVLFNGSSSVMRLQPDEGQRAELGRVLEDMRRDYAVDDTLREEMLRMHLKRFIILSTRIARDRFSQDTGHEKAFDIVRRFHALVDRHFREKKQVREYAEMLHRSPKTLANLFAACGCPSPRSIIRERINAEAKRLLLYTTRSAKETALMLGFEDMAVFSRFFSQMNGESITDFRARENRRER